jgi:hypothetical protein
MNQAALTQTLLAVIIALQSWMLYSVHDLDVRMAVVEHRLTQTIGPGSG